MCFLLLGIKKLRFKPAYNPYTEPSMEIFSYHEGKAPPKAMHCNAQGFHILKYIFAQCVNVGSTVSWVSVNHCDISVQCRSTFLVCY